MVINKANIANALHSIAPDHVVAVVDDIYDEGAGKYQKEINESKIEAEETSLEIESIEETLVTQALRKSNQILSEAEKTTIRTNLGDEREASSEGMGYVVLRKDLPFAEQVTKENTIYEIRYDFDLGGASVTIPKGCLLKFSGGKIKNGLLNLAECRIEGSGLMCDIANPRKAGYPLSAFLSSTSDKALNTRVVQTLCDSLVPIRCDYPAIEFDNEIYVSRLCIEGVLTGHSTLTFSNGKRGFVWTKGAHSNVIKHLNIISEGNCLDTNDKGIYQSCISDCNLTSNGANCVYMGTNRTGSGHSSFDITFDKVYVVAPKGCGFYGVNGNTVVFNKVSCGNCEVVFYNCQGQFNSFNGTFATNSQLAKVFFKTEITTEETDRFRCFFVNCNFEDFVENVLDCSGHYIHLLFENCTFYTPANKYKLQGLRSLRLRDCRGYWGNPEGDVIVGNENFEYDGQTIYLILPDNQIKRKSVFARKAELPRVETHNAVENGFATENFVADKIRVKSIQLWGHNEITINNPILETGVPQGELLLHSIGEGNVIYVNMQNDDTPTNYRLIGFNLFLAAECNPLTFFLKNNSQNVTIIIRPGNAVTQRPSMIIPYRDMSLKPGEWAEFLLFARPTENSVPVVYLKQVFSLEQQYEFSNAGDQKPSNPRKGHMFYDTTLNKPIWWTGSAWVDANGTTV